MLDPRREYLLLIGLLRLRLPEFLDNWRMNLAILAEQRTSHLYPPVETPAFISVRVSFDLWAILQPEGLRR